MKLSASLIALYLFQYHGGVTTGFNQFTVSSYGKPVIGNTSLKSSTDYLGKLANDRLSNDMQPVALKSVQTDGQRVGAGREGPRFQQTAFQERELDQRLARLAQKERNLEQRLARLTQTERELQKRLTVVDMKTSSLQRNQAPYYDTYNNNSPYYDRQLNSDRRVSRDPYNTRDFSRDLYSDRRLTRDPYNTRDFSRDLYNGRQVNQTPSYSTKQFGSQLVRSVESMWDMSSPITVQGGSLRTWSYANPAVNRVHVLLKTDGRPLNADVELWHGPNNDPHKMKVYLEDGGRRTFCAFMDTPRSPNTIAIRNSAQLEFPMYASVGPDFMGVGDACIAAADYVSGEVIQGGALRTYPFDPIVASVAVVLKTDGRPLNARIELLQGPNNNKQVLEVHTEDGFERPFIAIIQTPGSGNVVRVVNTAPLEFPLYAAVASYEMVSAYEAYATDGVQVGRDW